jgi:hypothetical protein
MPELIPVIRSRPRWTRVRALAADAGFDSLANHRWVRTRLHARDAIKPGAGRQDRVHPERRRLRRHFPRLFYRQRAKAETIPSVIKRKFGNAILSRLPILRRKETLLMGSLYDIYRGIQLGLLQVAKILQTFFEDFNRATI